MSIWNNYDANEWVPHNQAAPASSSVVKELHGVDCDGCLDNKRALNFKNDAQDDMCWSVIGVCQTQPLAAIMEGSATYK